MQNVDGDGFRDGDGDGEECDGDGDGDGASNDIFGFRDEKKGLSSMREEVKCAMGWDGIVIPVMGDIGAWW